jgi:NAD(P)H-flavin reductase
MAPAPYRVAANQRETADTRTLSLEPAAGSRISYAPGQFTMIYAFGAGEIPISVSGDPAGGPELVQTVRDVGPTSGTICALSAGEEVGVRGPFGRGWPDPEPGDDLVIVAGGLGLAPLRPALYRALAGRERLGRLTLVYGSREPEQLLFRDEFDQWRQRDDLECGLIVDVAPRDWRGRVGVVPSLIDTLEIDPARTTALVCGPEVMMRFTANALLGRGLPPGRLFLSMERNMRCAVGHCGHCQWGSSFICRDGPVLDWSTIGPRIGISEL